MINLKQRIIVDYSSLKSVSSILLNGQNEIILLFFTLAIILEYFGEWNFGKPLKRIVVCFLILTVFETLFKSSIEMSFSISDKLLDKCKTTEFCSHYLASTKTSTSDSTLWTETVNLVKNFSSFWIHSLVSLIFKTAFIFTIQIYSLVHALTLILFPFICSLGILPIPGEKAFVSLFQSLLWLFVSPIVLSIIIVLIASVTNVGIGPHGEVGLEGLLHLMIISLFSLGSLFLSWSLCNGDGVASFGSKMSQMGTTILTMAGINSISNIGKGTGIGLSGVGTYGSSVATQSLKGKLSSAVKNSISQKGLKVSGQEIANSKNHPLNSPIIPKNSEAYNSLSKKEKVLHKMDSIFNANENRIAKQGMIRDLSKLSKNNPNDLKINASKFKENARRNLNPLNSELPNYKNNIKATGQPRATFSHFTSKNIKPNVLKNQNSKMRQ